MEIAYLHLVTNHIPIIGIPFALFVLVWGLWRKSDEIKITSFVIFSVLGLMTLGVFLLGKGGEDFVEELPGVMHDAIESHERAATVALISVLAVALVSAFALLRYRIFGRTIAGVVGERVNIFPRWIVFLTLVLALGSAGVLGYTGRLGGKIRHTEFHGGVQATDNDANDVDANGEQEEGGGRRRGRNRGGR
jgi:hypothetical protein